MGNMFIIKHQTLSKTKGGNVMVYSILTIVYYSVNTKIYTKTSCATCGSFPSIIDLSTIPMQDTEPCHTAKG